MDELIFPTSTAVITTPTAGFTIFCEVCGAPIAAKSTQRKYCTEKCKKQKAWKVKKAADAAFAAKKLEATFS